MMMNFSRIRSLYLFIRGDCFPRLKDSDFFPHVFFRDYVYCHNFCISIKAKEIVRDCNLWPIVCPILLFFILS